MRTPLRPEPHLPLWSSVLVGALPVALAVGAGHLVAGLTKPTTSPFIALANGTIDRSPMWLTDFAKEQFGAEGTFNDKFVLQLGMGVTLAVVALLLGLLTRKRPNLLLGAITVMGLVGFYVVTDRPFFELLDLRAPLAALVAGVGSFLGLWFLAVRGQRGTAGAADPVAGTGTADPGTPDSQTRDLQTQDPHTPDPDVPAPVGADEAGRPSRRGVLVGSAAVAAGAGVATVVGQSLTGTGELEKARRALGTIRPAVPAPAVPAAADLSVPGLSPFLTPIEDFYRVDINLTLPQIFPDEWRLKIHGMVDNPMTLTYEDLMERELIERTVTMTCVSNELGGPYISTTNWTGVRLADILEEAGVQPGADQLFATSFDGWTCGAPVEDVMQPEREAMLAVAWNQQPLPIAHGFPVRVLVPGLYGFVSATKWVVDFELTTFKEKTGYWKQRQWGERGPIKTMSRIETPGAFAQVKADAVVIAGSAWAQPRGIAKVEVRIDEGEWRECRLGADVNDKTWRKWSLKVDGLESGVHSAQVRATDKTGFTQVQERTPPIPGGATGWHSTRFVVTG